MWTNEQRRRYDVLCRREQANQLSAAEAEELAALVQQLADEEARYLGPANERKAQEIAELTAAAERLEGENRQLRQYLTEHVRETKDGLLVPLTDTASFHIERLRVSAEPQRQVGQRDHPIEPDPGWHWR